MPKDNGLVTDVVERNPFTLGDSSTPSKTEKLQEFLGRLQEQSPAHLPAPIPEVPHIASRHKRRKSRPPPCPSTPLRCPSLPVAVPWQRRGGSNLQPYLSGPPAAQPRRRRKKKLPSGSGRAGMRIVDDDVGWSSIAAVPEKEEEEDEGDMPVVAEFIDERPDEVKLMEKFRTNSKCFGKMMSGVRAGLVSADVLWREQQELRKQERSSKHLEEESRHTETIFRDKSGRKRDLVQERLEQQQKDEAKSERDEQYARWGRGLAQGRQQQQNVEDAIKEMQKPLARYIDDEDLDRMLREQEREGDPMAEFIRKRKAKESKEKKEKPRYSGPAPPLNRFNIWPGHRWDGVDRSNGFEQQFFARMANKKAAQEFAYKWSIEDFRNLF
eukprot:XP_024998983.1 BUD13 homolog [Gallus gallus]